MEKSRKIFVGILLFVVSVEICLAQHWSYGLQPGGKRNAENLVESFQEIANEMGKLGEVQKSECPGSYRQSRFSDLKEAMESLMEGEARRKI
ncbi:PREDICTED: progonadoliberin-1 [Chlamydotis macqueenii]|uniref:progonadoliberin-1 n=1 Tax=Chlamydotis macqueenii TaxID=187382 RepID=UPI000529BF82|nr:PREDICTED: progonadoliberin-1 [Chlamydotis macqueenii]